MQNITSACLEALYNDAVQSIQIHVAPLRGSEFDITENDIVQGGFSYDSYTHDSGMLQIGTMTAAEINLTLENTDGRFNGIWFAGAILTVKLRILLENGQYEVIPFGVFTVDEQPRSGVEIDIAALDNMVRLDVPFDPSVFPPSYVSEQDIVQAAMRACGLQCNDYSMFRNTSDIQLDEVQSESTITWRQVVMWCCQLNCVNGIADENGYICFKFYEKYVPKPLQTEAEESLETEYGDLLLTDEIVENDFKITEAERYMDGSTYDEEDCMITGCQFSDGEDDGAVYPADADMEYGIQITGNRLWAASNQKEQKASDVNAAIAGFTYFPYQCNITPFLHLQLMDGIDYVRNGTHHHSMITHLQFTLNGGMSIAADAQSKTQKGYASLGALTPGQQAIVDAVSGRVTKTQEEVTRTQADLNRREQSLLLFNEAIAGSMGFYTTYKEEEDGSRISYMHDKPILEESKIIYTFGVNGFAWTNDGWNNGNPVWEYGLDNNGNAIVALLDTIGIKAEWIRAGSITTDKLTIGMSERGTNVILDSSFESNTTVEPATYDESGAITAPAHNTYWKAVTFHGGTTWDVTDSVAFPNIEPGGFDGNRAITDANLKGQATGGTVWYQGVATMEPFAVTVTTHMLSFYLRALRWPHTVEQGTDTVHIQYAAKIHWLDAQKAELQTSVNTFDATNSTTDWQRVYTAVTPPNGAAFAELAIGYFCTDPPQYGQDPGTGEQGHYDVAFASLDGILLEAGTELDTWTCAPSEVNNVGVLMDSNGFRVEKGKFLVVDESGTAYMYSDADQILTLVGGLISQLGNQRLYIKNGYVYFQFQNENGQWVNNGLIGIDGQTEPMYFSCNNGFKFNLARPLINDAQRIPANGSINSWLQPGWYYNESTADAKTIDGVPVGVAFILRVENCGNNIIQTWTSIEADICYKRYYQTWSPEGWQGWKKYSSDGVTKDAMWVDHFYPNQIFMDGVFSAASGGVTAQVELTTRGSPYGIYDTGGIYSTSDVRARDFINNSDRSTKENISEKADLQAVELIKSLKFYSYDYIAEDSTPEAENAKKSAKTSLARKTPIHMELGIMADEAPQEILSGDGKGISLYPYVSLCAKAIQELTERVKELEEKVRVLQGEKEGV